MSAHEQNPSPPGEGVLNEKSVDNSSPSDQNSLESNDVRDWTHEEEVRARVK